MALSFVTYTGDGNTTAFNLTFPYINKTDVTVLVNEVSTSFTWLSSSQVSISPAPASLAAIKIQRSTNKSAMEVDFVDSAILTEADLDKANQQNFYLSQEAKDDADVSLKQNSTTNWDGESKILQNLATPVAATDGATKGYIDTQTNNAFDSAAYAATSETNAATSETNAAASLDHFTDRYLGASAIAPTTDLDGNQLLDGAMYWNSTDGIIYTYDLGNTSWVRIKPNATEQANITSAVSNASNINAAVSNQTNINAAVTNQTNINACVSNEANINSAVSNETNITTAANNINDIRNFSEVYRISSTAPSSSLTAGDLWWDTTANELKAYSSGTSAWQSTAPSTTSQNNINIVAGDVVHAEDMGSIADALTTESGNGDITTCATNISNINSVASNSTSINLVGNSITNVNNTGNSIASVNTVSQNIASVTGVNAAIASVNTCAADISKIVDTANDLNEAVSEIDTCATNISNINAVGNDIANVNAVASDATDIGVVAGKSSEIALLGTSSNVSAMNTLGTSQVVSDLNSCASNASNISTVAGISAGVNFFTDRYRVAATAPTSDLDSGDLWWDETNSELRAYSGSAWQSTAPSAVNQTHINNVSGALVYSEDNGSITDALNTSSTTGDIATVSTNIDEIARLGTAQAVSDIQTLGTATNVGHLQTVSGAISNVQTVSGSIADVNRYAEEYTISGSAPGSPSVGDLWMDTSANVLKYRTSSAWASLTAGIAELVQDVTPELGAALDCLNNNINNVGTLDGSNLQIDFGSIA